MATSQHTGIADQSTRPTRRAARDQATGLGSMLTNNDQPTETPTPPPVAAVAPATRLATAEAKRVQKVPYATQVDLDTAKRVDWLIRSKGFKKTDITCDALDALLDSLNVPAADDIP